MNFRLGSRAVVACGALLLGTASFSRADPQFPKNQGWVTDAAGVLDAASRQALEARLAQIQQQTSAEIAVATVPDLQGDSIEDFSNKLFRQWGIGQKATNNGVLILIAIAEHKARIEVGYGLEPILTDGDCGEIIREQMAPLFKENRYGEGLLVGVNEIANYLQSNGNPAPAHGGRLPPSFIVWLWVALIILFVASRSLRSGRGRYYGGGWVGGGFGGGGFSGGGFGGFGGGSSGGGGASGGW